MMKQTFSIPKGVSASLAPLLGQGGAAAEASLPAAVAAGGRSYRIEERRSEARIDLLLESHDPDSICRDLGDLADGEGVKVIGEGFLSAQVGAATLERLVSHERIDRVITKKPSLPSLTKVLPDIRLSSPKDGSRLLPEDGTGVLIGVVDSGFDLSHPAFRDRDGRLRVEGLLDQKDGKELTTDDLEHAWASGGNPGDDPSGHGTHVACIAGGSGFNGCEGVAPGARFLLVRTDFLNTDDAVSWIFQKASGRPCVVNLSLGRHSGAHDGTDAEERLHTRLIGPGRIIVAAAGNDRQEDLHIGAQFHPGQVQEVPFDLLAQGSRPPGVTLNLWYAQQDRFDINLVSPAGEVFQAPALEATDVYRSSRLEVQFARRRYAFSKLVQVQITVELRSLIFQSQDLTLWKLRIACRKAKIGRLDGWFHNKGYARFRAHPMVETSRTLGVPATGDGCLAVASHVTRSSWTRDLGETTDSQVIPGRTSFFSGLGPTRDGRWKPDLSAPGQYVTAALAENSEVAGIDERVLVKSRLVTLEGTSMAAPAVTGIVALLLQKKPSLDLAEARRILTSTARHDSHTGPAPWDPAYGFGKVDVAAALAKL